MSTHTPGPWKVSNVNGRWVEVPGEKIRGSIRCYESYANARLIAAAPALLEALEAAVQCMERMPTSWGAAFECDKARAAIAQAKGDK